MRILLTGNMGYVGSVVVRHLRAVLPRAELVGLDTGYFAHCLTAARILPETRLERQYFADVRRPPAALFAGVDAVVHLAAISNDPMGSAFAAVTLEINHRAGVELARRAKAAGVRRFVFASSCSMYGAAGDGLRDEGAPLNPLTAYAHSKVLTERDLAGMADERFQVTALRFATACGMSDRLRLDLVLNDFVASALATGRITVLSDGTPWRPLIHVEDMARAVEWALGRDAGAPFLAVNTGSDRWNYQVRDLAVQVAAALPGVTVEINEAAPPDKRSYAVDFALFRSLAPAHQPRVDLPQAIAGLVVGLRAMAFHDAEFRRSALMRLRALSELRAAGLLDEELWWVEDVRAGRRRPIGGGRERPASII